MLTFLGIVFVVILLFWGMKIIRPVDLALVERFGKYIKTLDQGFHWVIPIIDKVIRVNVTERMVDIEPQMVITRDKLNAIVDAIVYYQIKDVKKSIYNVDDHKRQLAALARTTLRAVIGKMTLTEANENRDEINLKVEEVLDKETDSYGVEVLRVEIQKIEPPQDVQDSMNKVVKAEQEKIAARDLANAAETKADGERRAEIQKAEGIKQGLILKAEGEAAAIIKVAEAKAMEIKVVNESLTAHFKGEAQTYKALETTAHAMANGSKFIIDSDSKIANIVKNITGIPTHEKK